MIENPTLRIMSSVKCSGVGHRTTTNTTLTTLTTQANQVPQTPERNDIGLIHHCDLFLSCLPHFDPKKIGCSRNARDTHTHIHTPGCTHACTVYHTLTYTHTHVHHSVFHPLLSVAPLYTVNRKLEGLFIEAANVSPVCSTLPFTYRRSLTKY